MKGPGENGIWTAARLRARLAALRGRAPAPRLYVIWRATARPSGPEYAGYELPGQSRRQNAAAFDRYLLERDLAGANRLTVSVLVIREHLDASGLLRECVLERRRGAFDGPYFGNVARVEFVGAATRVRRYRALPDGRLAELPAGEPEADPPAADDVYFSGDDAAVRAALGSDVVIVDRRTPSLPEDLAGLSAVIHARRGDGVQVGCGIGWHGDIAFVLLAEFPRLGGPISVPRGLEDELEAELAARGLIRYETRLDARGFCVIARARGERTLVAMRMDGPNFHLEPYEPGRTTASNEDQRRWMTYAENYEARTILDSWPTGDGETIVVLTIDPDQEAWLHTIDADGVETARVADNAAAAAVMYREQINPPADLIAAEATASADLAAAGIADHGAGFAIEYETAPPDSLLAKVLAWSRVTASLDALTDELAHGAMESQAVSATREELHALLEPLAVLGAGFAAGSLRRLIVQAEAEELTVPALATALHELSGRLRDELALLEIVTHPQAPPAPEGEPPFGPLVEQHFPVAAYDIEEAVRCLALRRSTAAVTHAAKVMRSGLQALAALLSLPDLTELTWARMIETIRVEGGRERDLLEALALPRRAWRAPGLAPAERYAEQEAEAVLTAVEGFMRLVAARLEADAASQVNPDRARG